jgi:hypothetical protein
LERPDPTRISALDWKAEGERNILFHEALPLLGAGDHRMDVVAWLRGLGLDLAQRLDEDLLRLTQAGD